MGLFRIDKKIVLIICTILVALIMIICVSLIALPKYNTQTGRAATATPANSGAHLQIIVEKMTATPVVFKLSTGKLVPTATPKPTPHPVIIPTNIVVATPAATKKATPTPNPTPQPTPTPTPPTNLLTNPTFNTLSGWSCNSAASAASNTLTIAYTSDKSGGCQETITLQANHTYRFSANVSGDHPTIVVGSEYYWIVGDLSGYQNLSATFSTGSTTSWTVDITGTNSQGGAVYAQDASLTLVS